MRLRGFPIFAAAAFFGFVVSLPASAQGVEDEVRSTVVAMFDALRAKDETGLRAVTLPETRIVGISIVEGDARLRTTHFEEFTRSVMESELQFDERNWDVEVSVRGELANVWQRFNMYIDGALSHCGLEAIHLFRSPEGWKIIQISETVTRDGCAPEPQAGEAGRVPKAVW